MGKGGVRVRVCVEVHVGGEAAGAEADEHDTGGVGTKGARVGVQPADSQPLVAQAGVQIVGAVGPVK